VSRRTVILWRRVDHPGHEMAELTATAAGWRLSGIALLSHEGQPCRLEYRIECDVAWQTREVRVWGHRAGVPIALDLRRSPSSGWQVNGSPATALDGCVDVDLGFSPSTNLLPIRRAGLAVGGRVSVRAAWVRFPELTVEVLEQEYTRLGPATYRYESTGGAFRRELSVSADGVVLDYPGLWVAESTASVESHVA
jgi:hypothetical protein